MPATFEPFPVTPEQEVYEALPEFAAYWQAWEVWNERQNAYSAAYPSQRERIPANLTSERKSSHESYQDRRLSH